jgi:hypothetical protein
MQTLEIARTDYVPQSKRFSTTLEVPESYVGHRIEILVIPLDFIEQPEKKPRVPGSMKGKMWMADDFDAPLDDFKEYM